MDEQECVRVLIVEDEDIVLSSLADLIRNAPGFVLAGAFRDAEELLKRLSTKEADVALVDIKLPGMDGIELIRRLKKRTPQIQSLMLTVFDDDKRVFESIKAGASGYLLKSTPDSDILKAIGDLHGGGSPMSSRIARRVLNYFRPAESESIEEAGLTDRELEVLRKLSEGLRYREIAEELSISLSTVRTHCHNIYDKLHVRTRTEALKKALPF